MPETFNVLKCFECSTFQVHAVKKASKWQCKMCGVKQSLKKVYDNGSASDCRKHVQKMNSLRGQMALHEDDALMLDFKRELPATVEPQEALQLKHFQKTDISAESYGPTSWQRDEESPNRTSLELKAVNSATDVDLHFHASSEEHADHDQSTSKWLKYM